MKLKQISRIWISIIMTFILTTGCSDQGATVVKQPEVIYFRLAEIHPSDHPTTKADKEFARLVEERTKGRIIIKVYDSEQLGPEKAVLDQVRFGAIDFTRLSMGQVAEISPQLNVLQLPYIYRDSDHMWQVLNSDIGDFFLESIEDKGLIGLAWYDGGARSFYNSVREVKTLSDLEGLKFRVMESQLMVEMARALGTSVIPMAYGEVYSSIQTGVIDGAENNFPSYETSLHYEVAKYFTIDEHVRVPEMLIASKKILDRITEEDLEIIMACAKESEIYQRDKWRIEEKESEKKLRELGSIITEIEDREAFVEAVRPLYDRYANDYLEIVKRIQEME
ncbi:TRAP transporter substrate-binding protein [Petrocella sp. FN5]|uniref:TRAP transporter substrate-binding protein n=1 Tax=Petrocella sp. FN5 TaxID=3032002 RepID=UPI0023DA6AD4|nr:TRAP transporter substrate-binding protein [Petrocella sp. FN5]MDF1617285.1 TRAP transporter substrate-binding protein [Petrocella sp. FN5]